MFNFFTSPTVNTKSLEAERLMLERTLRSHMRVHGVNSLEAKMVAVKLDQLDSKLKSAKAA
jgi:hypothetical protein